MTYGYFPPCTEICNMDFDLERLHCYDRKKIIEAISQHARITVIILIIIQYLRNKSNNLQDAEPPLHCLLSVSFTHACLVCLPLAFICGKGPLQYNAALPKK